MKHIYKAIIFLTLLLTMPLQAQNFGNNWIDYSQKYYKIKVWQDGVYRINYTIISQAIPELSSIDPRSFQLFARGEEQHIFVSGEDDGSFDENDFIEFFGRKNDGYFDTQLYPQPSDQTNKRYSLFTDTLVYYLTWNSSQNNRRLTLETDNNFNAYGNAASWFWREVYFERVSNYYFGRTNAINSTDPEYTRGEGWNGPNIAAPQNNVATAIPTPHPFTSGPPAHLEIFYKTVSNTNLFLDHRYVLNLGNTTIDTLIEGHGSHRFTFNLPANMVSTTNTMFRFSYPVIPGNPTANSVFSNYTFRYARQFNMENLQRFDLFLPDNANSSKFLINFSNFNAAGSPVWIFDNTNHRKIQVFPNGNNWRAIIPNSGNGAIKHLHLSNENQIVNIAELKPVNYNAAQPGQFNNLRDFTGAEYLIIAYSSLMESSNAYAAYRNTKYSTKVVSIEELYDQFSHGIQKHPFSIRNFANLALSLWDIKPEFLLLAGKSISPQHIRTNTTNFAQCLVPTFGFPSSDNLFTNGLGNATMWEPGIATGRISANNPQQLNAYLNKVIEYESQEPAMWMKQVMHFGGGMSASEQQVYQNYLSRYKTIIEDTLFGGNVFTYLKTSSAPIEETQSALIASFINNGVSLMTFFGHATGSGFDVSIDNPANYNNFGKYPMLIANSCLAGDIHQPPGAGFSQSEDFVLIPNRGTIGFIASVGLGVPFQLHVYSDTLYNQFGRKRYGEPIGKCMQYTVRAVQTEDQFRKATVLETTLHGDPAVILNSHPLPDYAIDQQSVFYNPAQVTTEVDSF
ncbi:MAG: C25 family cysteine peptidase, partial [Flavobacteriales bacterium]